MWSIVVRYPWSPLYIGNLIESSDNQESKANFARAFELKDRRLTQEENFKTTALYYSAITGNMEKEIAVALLYRQIYPRSVDAANLQTRVKSLFSTVGSH